MIRKKQERVTLLEERHGTGRHIIMPSRMARPMVPMKNVNVHKDKRPRFWPGADVKWREAARFGTRMWS